MPDTLDPGDENIPGEPGEGMEAQKKVKAYWGINRVGEVITPPFYSIKMARAYCEKMLPGGAGRIWFIAQGVVDREDVGTPTQPTALRSEEHTSELQSPCNLVCRLLLEKK